MASLNFNKVNDLWVADYFATDNNQMLYITASVPTGIVGTLQVYYSVGDVSPVIYDTINVSDGKNTPVKLNVPSGTSVTFKCNYEIVSSYIYEYGIIPGIPGTGLVVNFEKDSQGVVTCDKTFDEISAKIAAGNDVIGYVTGADGMTYAMLPTIKAGTSGVVFSATFYDDQNKGVVYQVECYQSEGHDFFEWSVVELSGGGGVTPVEITLTEDNVIQYVLKQISEGFFGIALVLEGEFENNKRISLQISAGDNTFRFELIECDISGGYSSLIFLSSSEITEEEFFGFSPKLVIS